MIILWIFYAGSWYILRFFKYLYPIGAGKVWIMYVICRLQEIYADRGKYRDRSEKSRERGKE